VKPLNGHEKSDLAKALDELQAKLRQFLKDKGFRTRGRAFNRATSDGLTQVVKLQMGSFDPPGTTYFPDLRENRYGKFAINLGVYVPEVAKYHGGGTASSFVQEYHCCLRTRLRRLEPQQSDVWWDIRQDDGFVGELQERLGQDAFPFFHRFETRDAILTEYKSAIKALFVGGPPRIVCAIILAERGQVADARALLAEQAKETGNPGHPAYVRALAEKLGLGDLEA
jgi:hypothetical protein